MTACSLGNLSCPLSTDGTSHCPGAVGLNSMDHLFTACYPVTVRSVYANDMFFNRSTAEETTGFWRGRKES